MKAMILAAGRGERMRPLTDTTPKPLLRAGGKPLVVWHLERLAAAGFREVVINHAHLGGQIVSALGDGGDLGLRIAYSAEPPGALETGGGIARALPLLGEQAFLVVSGDIWCDWDFARARGIAAGGVGAGLPAVGGRGQARSYKAHLVFIDNPPHHPGGDFCLQGALVGDAGNCASVPMTYSGIGVFSPAFFSDVPRGAAMKLRPLLDAAIAREEISGEHHAGRWVDVGTPQRLAELDRELGAAA